MRVFVLRIGEDLGRLARLDDAAALHHRDVAGDLAHDAEVMGDEQHRHAEPGLQILQHLEDLRLHGDVERGGRLVRDEQVRAVGERHRDHHALALAAGELMRIGAEPRGGVEDADLVQQFDHALARVEAARPPCKAMISPICRSMVWSGLSEVIGSWNTIVMPAPRISRNSASRHFQHVAALEEDLPAGMARGGVGQQPHDRLRGDRLARAGFAHQRERLAALQLERDAIDDRLASLALREGDGEIADLEQGASALTRRSFWDRRRRAPLRR